MYQDKRDGVSVRFFLSVMVFGRFIKYLIQTIEEFVVCLSGFFFSRVRLVCLVGLKQIGLFKFMSALYFRPAYIHQSSSALPLPCTRLYNVRVSVFSVRFNTFNFVPNF